MAVYTLLPGFIKKRLDNQVLCFVVTEPSMSGSDLGAIIAIFHDCYCLDKGRNSMLVLSVLTV